MSVFFGGMIVQYIGIVVGIIVAIISYFNLTKTDETKTGSIPIPPNFSWAKAEKQFREIHEVIRNVTYFYIECENEICQCELVCNPEFRKSSTGYYIVKMYFITYTDGFAMRYGMSSQNEIGKKITICTRRGINDSYIIDHLYYGLDVGIEVPKSGPSYLIVYTDIPGKMPIQTVKNHFESMKY